MADSKKKPNEKKPAAPGREAEEAAVDETKPRARSQSRSGSSAAGSGAKQKTSQSKQPEKKPAAKRAPAKKAEGAKKPAAKKAPEKKQPEPIPVVVRASAKYVRIAPRKARLVADQVRGLQIDEARALLQFSPRGAARDIQKLIDSAAANAENNHDLIADEMRVAEITVDEGPTLRRYQPRALGRATKINKRTSHIALALTPEEVR
jgi:ribosomal protein L22